VLPRLRFRPGNVWTEGESRCSTMGGALGFWGALREVFPHTREQRCWFHKISNVVAALPKSAHPEAKKALTEIWNAEDKNHAMTG
jgi:transposase-like protein